MSSGRPSAGEACRVTRLGCPQCGTMFTPDERRGSKCPGCGYASPAAPSLREAGLGVSGPPGQGPPAAGGGGFRPVASDATSGTSVAALVLGIVAIPLLFLLIPGLLAVVFGIRGLKEASTSGETGKRLAVAGIVLGAVSLGLGAAFWFVELLEEGI